MFLQRLCAYAEQMEDQAPTLYSKARVRYVIELDFTGRLLNPEPKDLSDPGNKQGLQDLLPRKQRSVAIQPHLLADNSEYTFGLPREGSSLQRVAECHTAYLRLLEQCVAESSDPGARAVQDFLSDNPLSQLRLPEGFDPGATVVFAVAGQNPTAQPAVQRFWATLHAPRDDGEEAAIMQCVVCGERRPILKRLPGNIKGIPGGQTSGTALISANTSAFESYGLEASQVAPICMGCAEHFTAALNHLLLDKNHHLRINNLVFVFWTCEEVGLDLAGWFNEPDLNAVRELIDTVRSGKRIPEVDETAFYAATLSASGARVVVRDWIDTTVGRVKEHLARWFEKQAITDMYGDEPRPLGLYALGAGTVRDARKELTPPTLRVLLRCAIGGTPLPQNLLHQAIRRNCAEGDVTRQRAALIKLVLSGHQKERDVDMTYLQKEHPDPAYHCGRLLAVLESIQRSALGPKLSATVVDRYYGTASTAPAMVYPRLLRGAEHHLSKLSGSTAANALRNRLQEVTTHIPAFPRTLKLEEQGVFALGFYHQRAHDYSQALIASEKKKAKKAANDSTTTVPLSTEEG